MGLLQPMHLLVILAIVLLIVGPGKLAGLGGAIGSSIRDFRKSVDDDAAPAQLGSPAVQPTPIDRGLSPASVGQGTLAKTEETGT